MAQQSTFSAQLLAENQALWTAMLGHPFVQEVAAGTLDADRFDFWVRQDHYFVMETRRLWAYTASRASDEEIMKTLLGAAGALDSELQLFRDHARDRGFSLDVSPAPVCQGYASYTMHVAAFADFFELFTVIYGAEKAYFDSWSGVKERTPTGSAYSHWIANWTSPAFAEFVGWIGATLDRLAVDQPAATLERARRAFKTTARFEYLFWDAAYQQHDWPAL